VYATTTDELVAVFRREVDDVVSFDGDDSDRLWSDADAYGYLTEACDAVAKGTDGLFKVLRLQFTAGEPTVKLPAYVLHIREMRHVEANRTVSHANANDTFHRGVDYGSPFLGASMFDSFGRPTTFVRDYEKRALRLIPIPTEDGTLEAQCTVTIATPMLAGLPLPFLDTEDQRLLLTKMKALAYLKHDAETFDKFRADRYASEFDTKLAERKSRLRSYRRTPAAVRMDW
jgi:hypothetical protein